jgi:hypothetical protein
MTEIEICDDERFYVDERVIQSADKMMRFGKTSGQMTDTESILKSKPDDLVAHVLTVPFYYASAVARLWVE